MSFLFGRRKTPQEMLRQNQRALNKAMRDLDRERQHMEQQEKKIIADIKKMAKQGQMVIVLLRSHFFQRGSISIRFLKKIAISIGFDFHTGSAGRSCFMLQVGRAKSDQNPISYVTVRRQPGYIR